MKKILSLIAFTLFCAHSSYAQMMLQYQTPTPNTLITLPLYGTVNVSVNWGDGSLPQAIHFAGSQTHNYANAGNYVVTISGMLTHFGTNFFNTNNPYLLGVFNWDNLGLTSLNNAFCNATSLTSVPTSLPSTVTDLSYMFFNATTFNQSIDSWNTANVTDMNNMFFEAKAFNQPIGSWNTANVTNMSSMFMNAYSFNQPVGNWNTGNVINMAMMLEGAIVFNQPIGNWNTTNVIAMWEMFNSAYAFNQPIGSWNTGNVSDMASMFMNASAFNQPISTWNTTKVTNMGWMFSGAFAFNQPIASWNTANVTDMNSMFANTKVFNQPIDNWNTLNVTKMNNMFSFADVFNQPIGSWNTSNVTDMSSMFFQAKAFNQPIDSWNTANITNMSEMFYMAGSFNQPISSWNTANVTDMSKMFYMAFPFNQPIGSWNTTSVTDMSSMFKEDTLCTAYYDNLLNGWASQALQSGINFDGGHSQYSTASSTARAKLISTNGWTINDGDTGTNNTKCKDISIPITTNLQANTASQATIGIYPNPSTGRLTISSNVSLENIIIYNPSGTLVYQTNTSALQQNIDLSHNEPGLYLVKAGNETMKFVKE